LAYRAVVQVGQDLVRQFGVGVFVEFGGGGFGGSVWGLADEQGAAADGVGQPPAGVAQFTNGVVVAPYFVLPVGCGGCASDLCSPHQGGGGQGDLAGLFLAGGVGGGALAGVATEQGHF